MLADETGLLRVAGSSRLYPWSVMLAVMLPRFATQMLMIVLLIWVRNGYMVPLRRVAGPVQWAKQAALFPTCDPWRIHLGVESYETQIMRCSTCDRQGVMASCWWRFRRVVRVTCRWMWETNLGCQGGIGQPERYYNIKHIQDGWQLQVRLVRVLSHVTYNTIISKDRIVSFMSHPTLPTLDFETNKNWNKINVMSLA